jgi:hypothetical protein
MTNAEIYNEIDSRIQGRDLPTDPAEFLRLVRNIPAEQELIETSSARINPYRSMGYAELDLLLNDYCSCCKLEKRCDWNNQVRMAAGNNYPFWLLTWQIVKFSLHEGSSSFLDGKTVMCTHYQDNTSKKEESEITQQPLRRLMQIIGGKREESRTS